jgi:hypothetical protein
MVLRILCWLLFCRPKRWQRQGPGAHRTGLIRATTGRRGSRDMDRHSPPQVDRGRAVPIANGGGFQPQHRHKWRERPVSGCFVPPHGTLVWRTGRRQKSRLPASCGGVAAQCSLPWPDRRRQEPVGRGLWFFERSLRPFRAGGRAGRMSPCDPLTTFVGRRPNGRSGR